jgi:hypothetical protein
MNKRPIGKIDFDLPRKYYPRVPPIVEGTGVLDNVKQQLSTMNLPKLKKPSTMFYDPRFADVQGKGFTDKIKSVAKFIKSIPSRTKKALQGPRTDFSKRFKDTLQKDGNKKVVSIQVGRHPLQKGVKLALDTLSLGKFSKTQKQLNYDQIYHQYAIVTFDDGSTKVVQYNHQIEEGTPTHDDIKDIKVSIPVNKDLTFNELIQNTVSGKKDAFRYNPATNNCQLFVKSMIDSNNLMPKVDTAKVLETQDAKKLIDSIPPPLKRVPLLVTDLAQSADRFIHGDGMNPRRQLARARMLIDGIL